MNGSIERVCRARYEGHEWLICPVTMIVTNSVWSGSNGPMLVATNEVRKSVREWNHCPVTVDHPHRGRETNLMFADHPQLLDRFAVGFLRNPRLVNNRLQADAFIDPKRVKAVDARVYQALLKSRPLPCSVGFKSSYALNQAGKTWKGQPYKASHVAIEPDHLAILLDRPPACGLRDGAGLLVT